MPGRWLVRIGLLVLFLLLLAGCGKPQPPADWPAYQNEQYGYAFKYPADCFYGPMPSYCKEKPPQERPPECLCFLDGENPEHVFLQVLTIDGEEVKMASWAVSYYHTPPYNPPPDADLVDWVKRSFSGLLHQSIPDEPNLELDGIPAVRVYDPPGLGTQSSETIYFIRGERMFQISLQDVDDPANRELYDQILCGFEFSD